MWTVARKPFLGGLSFISYVIFKGYSCAIVFKFLGLKNIINVSSILVVQLQNHLQWILGHILVLQKPVRKTTSEIQAVDQSLKWFFFYSVDFLISSLCWHERDNWDFSAFTLGFYSQVLVRQPFPTFGLRFPLPTLVLKLLVVVPSGPLTNAPFPPLCLGLALRD